MSQLQIVALVLLPVGILLAIGGWYNAIDDPTGYDWPQTSRAFAGLCGELLVLNAPVIAGLICSVISWRKKQKRGLAFVVMFVLLFVIISASLFYE